MHESFNRNIEEKMPSERSFGLVGSGFFLMLSIAPLLKHVHKPIRFWAIGVSVIFLGMAFFWQKPLKPFNRLWYKLGLVMFKVINPFIMAILFFCTVTPIGILMRLFGKDPMRLRGDMSSGSYWILRNPPGPPPDTMKNQF